MSSTPKLPRQTYLDQEEADWLDEYARENDRSVAAELRRLVRKKMAEVKAVAK